jgi:conjugative relaxase-like TrwC/TraI family protein
MMSAHKITAGHGYTYLTRQVAAQDASVVPPGGLGAYYAERGEAPGRWIGSGLGGVGIDEGAAVREAQMLALFGEGRHPDAERIEVQLRADGAGDEVVAAATALGMPFELNVANNEYLRQVAQLMTEWNRANGQPACTPVPPYMNARIRTAVGQALFAQLHGREAANAQELSGFIASQSRLGSRAVAGFDLTFSPVKSVSTLWALAPEPIARQIEAAHDAAVKDTVGWLERTATFTRLGRNGVRQVDTRGLIAAAFVHRTSRAGDPDLHTHVAISNKVQTLDGRWRALDGRVLLKATVAASERYNTRLEAEIRERLGGIRFEDRARPGRRPVREIVGVDECLLASWSSRRRDIDARRADRATAFQAEHNRPPTPVEAIELAQQATLETRPVKHEPTSEAEQRQRWQAEAKRLIGERAVVEMISGVVAPRQPENAIDADQLREVAQQVVGRVQSDRATWQRWHIIAEAQRELRRLSLPVASLDAALGDIVSVALDDYSIAITRPDPISEPVELRRLDGTSVYAVAGAQLYTSRTVLDAERTLLDAAQMFDGRRVHAASAEMALLESTANGLVLNDGQVRFVRELAGSGARCQLALAPAGTGKTTALRVLARAWIEDGGRVVALAPSAAAARVLGDATGTSADTIAKALHGLEAGGDLQLRADTLVVVDEAGMASTPDLAHLMRHAAAAGASVRLVGDDRQLAAIGAGGVLRDLAESARAVTLATAVRFVDEREAAAALAIREGRANALDFYINARRVRVGDEHTAATSAYEAWRADRSAGKDALLLAATRDQVTALNRRARADRLLARGTGNAQEAQLADGTALSAGDPIITRRNERRLQITATDWVKNGDRWTVDAVHPTGDISAIHRDTGRHVTLPASYVAEHVALGYAMTLHAAQGSTADTCHAVITGTESREQLYVALTRGRVENHAHVVLPGAADEHAAIRPDTVLPPAAIDVLGRVLDRDESARSASTEIRVSSDPVRQLGDAAAHYLDGLELVQAAEDQPPARPAPLPWLPPVPRCADDTKRRYLEARADQVSELADAVTRQVLRRSTPGAVINRRDPMLLSHRALWNATHTSDEMLTVREQLYQRHLQERTEAVSGTIFDARRRWLPLVSAIDPTASSAAGYPALAEGLTHAFNLRLDVDRLLPGLLEERDYGRAIETLRELTRQAGDREGLSRAVAAMQQADSLGVQSVSWTPTPSVSTYEPPSL